MGKVLRSCSGTPPLRGSAGSAPSGGACLRHGSVLFPIYDNFISAAFYLRLFLTQLPLILAASLISSRSYHPAHIIPLISPRSYHPAHITPLKTYKIQYHVWPYVCHGVWYDAHRYMGCKPNCRCAAKPPTT